jgi:hypothetical protein
MAVSAYHADAAKASNVIDFAARRALRESTPNPEPPAAPRAAMVPASTVTSLDDYRPAIDPIALQLQRCDEVLRHIAERRARLKAA